MKPFAVYQVSSDHELISDLMFRPTQDMVERLQEEYELVARIDANSLEHVYLVSNSGMFETLIERVAPMRSVSIGDVIYDIEADKYFCVDRCGFFDVNFV